MNAAPGDKGRWGTMPERDDPADGVNLKEPGVPNSDLVSTLVVWMRGLTVSLLTAVPLVVFAADSPDPMTQSLDPVPSPKLDPAEVVRIQVEALRINSDLDTGIALTYRFASPGNKSFTGPLARFTQMIRSSPYDRLLNHLTARYGPVAVDGDEAHQMVIIIDANGDEVAYVWVLTRQNEGKFKDCWMTDAVMPAQRPTQRKLTQRLVQGEALSACLM